LGIGQRRRGLCRRGLGSEVFGDGFLASGLRLGTPAVTTRGFRATEIRQLTGWIADILDDIKDEQRAGKIRKQVVELCGRFPVYQ